jgi:hypothetical protein
MLAIHSEISREYCLVTDENLHSIFLFDRAVDETEGLGAHVAGALMCTIRWPIGARIKYARHEPAQWSAPLTVDSLRVGN